MTRSAKDAPRPTSVRLPTAPPGDYLRCVAYWRDVESAMREHPRIEHLARREAGSFLDGEAARYLSEGAGIIMRQARAASESGERFVKPEVPVPDLTRLQEGAAFMRRRAEWLDLFGVTLKVEPLPPHLRELRDKCIGVVEAALLGSIEPGSNVLD